MGKVGGKGWVFGYGSLMWQPGFACEPGRPALLQGYHRRYCMYSIRNRGTEQEPGMMLGVLPGGQCTGLAFRFDLAQEAEVLAYLDEREGEGRANRRVVLPVKLLDAESSCLINTWTYLPRVAYEHYVGVLSEQAQAERILAGKGLTGTAEAYYLELMAALSRLKVSEPRLERLAGLIDQLRGQPASGTDLAAKPV